MSVCLSDCPFVCTYHTKYGFCFKLYFFFLFFFWLNFFVILLNFVVNEAFFFVYFLTKSNFFYTVLRKKRASDFNNKNSFTLFIPINDTCVCMNILHRICCCYFTKINALEFVKIYMYKAVIVRLVNYCSFFCCCVSTNKNISFVHFHWYRERSIDWGW